MFIATDVRTYADTALAQGKAALSNAGSAAALVNKRLVADAPKPAYAALGAADLVATAVTRRVSRPWWACVAGWTPGSSRSARCRRSPAAPPRPT
jgi:hypothetical protein